MNKQIRETSNNPFHTFLLPASVKLHSVTFHIKFLSEIPIYPLYLNSYTVYPPDLWCSGNAVRISLGNPLCPILSTFPNLISTDFRHFPRNVMSERLNYLISGTVRSQAL
jgi:hypothetical protein